METSELLQVLSPEGLRLLDALPAYGTKNDLLRTVAELRAAGHSPELVAAVLTQSKLRTKGAAKFGPFASRMLFTEAGLEQATRLSVAALHAGRFQQAGIRHVTDLGCGIGADSMAIAALDIEVTAVERDEVTAAIAAYNLAPWATASVVIADAQAHDIADGGVFLDPARRTSGHSNTSRLGDPADWSPPLDFAFGLAAGRAGGVAEDVAPSRSGSDASGLAEGVSLARSGSEAVGVKLGPGIDRDLIPAEAEAQWVSVDREVVEVGAWFGPLARPGIRRSALVIGEHGTAELHAGADAEDAELGTLGEYVYEPDGAVIRARLIGDLARSLNATMVSPGIAYVSSDAAVATPFARAFRVIASFAWDERVLRRELAARGIGTLEIKKRGVDVDPAQLRKKLSLKGAESATLIVTRIAGRHTALLVDRV